MTVKYTNSLFIERICRGLHTELIMLSSSTLFPYFPLFCNPVFFNVVIGPAGSRAIVRARISLNNMHVHYIPITTS